MSLPPEAALRDILDELIARCERESRQELSSGLGDECNHKEGHCIRYSREIYMAHKALQDAKRDRFGGE